MDRLAHTIEVLEASAQRRLEELFEFLRIPSVSTLPERREDVRRAAWWLKDACERAGLAASVLETDGHPVVFAQRRGPEGAPTVLVYGHYDVQPAEPLDDWRSPPFEPVVRDGNIYARGASDDKGQALCWIQAAGAWTRAEGGLPVTLKVLMEGEEEIGSPNLERWIAEHRALLQADCVAVSDSDQAAPGLPALTYGLRGLVYLEVRVRGASRDLHSGAFGGGIMNPIQALCDILSRLKDPASGRVLVDGFYDRVRPLADWEREAFRALPHDDEKYRSELGAPMLYGEQGYTTIERTTARPTLDICGIFGGFQGPGAKTVLPSLAGAKVSMRLVPDQRADEIAEAFVRTVRRLAPKEVEVEVGPPERFGPAGKKDARPGGADPVILERDTPWARAAEAALERGFGAKPAFIRAGGSIPVVLTFKRVLGLDCVLMGYGLKDDAAHAPNEKLCLEDYHRGCRASAAFLVEVAARAGRRERAKTP